MDSVSYRRLYRHVHVYVHNMYNVYMNIFEYTTNNELKTSTILTLFSDLLLLCLGVWVLLFWIIVLQLYQSLTLKHRKSLLMFVSSSIRNFLLCVFFGSTPVTQFCVYVLGKDRMFCAIANSYAFSIPMVLLYIYPYFLSRPLSQR
jgi:hypothetical protein